MTFKVGNLGKVKQGNDLFPWVGLTGICVNVYNIQDPNFEAGIVFGGKSYDYNFLFVVDDVQYFVSLFDTELEEVKDE